VVSSVSVAIVKLTIALERWDIQVDSTDTSGGGKSIAETCKPGVAIDTVDCAIGTHDAVCRSPSGEIGPAGQPPDHHEAFEDQDRNLVVQRRAFKCRELVVTDDYEGRDGLKV
jgi:hypothetical protein